MQPKRVIILGGGFGGVYASVRLDRIWHANPDVQVTLVSRANYFLMTPLLFEAASGVLEPRHAVNPIRPMFRNARFVQATVEKVDLNAKTVEVRLPQESKRTIEYDHLVLALGGVTNTQIIPGSEHATTFKTLADAIYLRNHTIQRFEEADAEPDESRRAELLSFVIIGAGLVGVELIGEMTDFVRRVARVYPRVDAKQIRFHLIEAGPRIIPEFSEKQAAYASRVLGSRGVTIHCNMRVDHIEPNSVHLADGTIVACRTVLLATGVIPNPLLKEIDLPKDRKGRILVDATMRSTDRQEVWALGDCASIPDKDGKPYPPLAQHAIREGKALAENITSAIRDRPVMPFVYQSQGSLAALGQYRGVGSVWGIPVRGFLAWWIWRTYYLFRMPRWERRLRIMLDWSVALFFANDVVQLDLDREEDIPAVES